MSGPRTLALPPEDQQIKKASADLVRAYGGQLAAAEMLGTRQQRLSDCGHRNTADYLRVDEVARLEDVTHGTPGHPHVTRALARRQGYGLFRVANAAPCGTDLLKLLADQARENGDIASAVLAAIADHRIEPHEAEAIITQIHEQQAVGAAMIASLEAIIAGEARL
jgi:hypothetical protein